MSSVFDACVIGAGPYGLSIAAHLNAAGRTVRVLGIPMSAWRFSVPAGMTLKSAGFASSLDHPGAGMTIGQYCASLGIPYADNYHPIRAEDFAAYGLAFQKQFVPQLEETRVTHLSKDAGLFTVVLENGESLQARKMILATGTSYYAHIPSELAVLPTDLVSHTCMHHSFAKFQGKELAVIGGGSSAVDVAASIYEAGVKVELFSRREIEFDEYPTPNISLLTSILTGPDTALGPGWQANVLAHAPWLFRYLPDDLRLWIVKKKLGPAAGCYARDSAIGRVPMHVGMRLESATESHGRLLLCFKDSADVRHNVTVDHLICGTGYVVDISKLAFLDAKLIGTIQTLQGSPRLTANFESTVSGLYFSGLASAVTFGPILRFIGGVGFAARTIARHLVSELNHDSSRSASKHQVSVVSCAD